jgi:hypothetical protein
MRSWEPQLVQSRDSARSDFVTVLYLDEPSVTGIAGRDGPNVAPLQACTPREP